MGRKELLFLAMRFRRKLFMCATAFASSCLGLVLGALLHHRELAIPVTVEQPALSIADFNGQIPVVVVDDRAKATYKMPGAAGITVLNLGAGRKYEGFSTKNALLLQWLDHNLEQHGDQLAILGDGGDTLYGGCGQEDILRNYHDIVAASGGASVVMGVELGLFPGHECYAPAKYEDFEERRHAVLQAANLGDGWPFVANEKYHRYCGDPACKYRYLNYGFLMGPIHSLHRVVKWILPRLHDHIIDNMINFVGQRILGGKHRTISQHWSWCHGYSMNDQGAAAVYMFEHPNEVTLDYAMSLVASTFVQKQRFLEVKSGRVWNNATSRVQCFVHGNGGRALQQTLLEELAVK